MVGYISRGIAYSAFLSASVVSLANPAPSLMLAMGYNTTIVFSPFVVVALPLVWGALFFLASLACLMGVITRTWVGEYIGIGALLVCAASLGLAQILAGMLVSGILISLGTGGLIAYRWYLVAGERRNAITRFKNLQSWYDRIGHG